MDGMVAEQAVHGNVRETRYVREARNVREVDDVERGYARRGNARD
jgi:hypothetical protein